MNTGFADFVLNLFKQVGIEDVRLAAYMDIFYEAFTTLAVNEKANYQWLEQLGDVYFNTLLVDHIYKKYPHLRNHASVKIVARLRILYAGKDKMCLMAEKWGFWPWINGTPYEKLNMKKPLLEDVFEAFFGACKIVGDKISPYYGYEICARVFEGMYKNVDFCVDQKQSEFQLYNTLVDSTTQLKELRDCFKQELSSLQYGEKKVGHQFVAQVFLGGEIIGTSDVICKLKDAKKQAAKHAVKYLAHKGFTMENRAKKSKKIVDGAYSRCSVGRP